MKTYKDCGRIFLGFSDIAELILRGLTDTYDVSLDRLIYGGDGEYMTYAVINGEAEVPSHYAKKYEYHGWLEIYDDMKKTCTIRADRICVYRAGDYGTLITADGNVKIGKKEF